jgi:hypothetical protein
MYLRPISWHKPTPYFYLSEKMTDKAEIPKRIKFDYLKSNYHREILVEGAHGGLTPKGHLQMSAVVPKIWTVW